MTEKDRGGGRSPQTTRVVLLGASNLAIGLPVVLRQLFAGLPRPLDIFAACGHGRSFCTWSRVLFRGLPGIDRCRLWTDLDHTAGPALQTLALVSDIGNDLMYGASPEQITRRVESCLKLLGDQGAQLAVVRLPLARVEQLSSLRYHATKALFFPRSGGSWPEMLRKARELDGMLSESAGRYAAALVAQPANWYGFDPLHIRRSRRQEAWRTILSAWAAFRPARATAHERLGLTDVVRLRLAAPAERRLFGRHQQKPQPALTVRDVAIRLY